MRPLTVATDLDQTLQTDLANTGRHTTRLHLIAFRQRIETLNTGITGDTFLGDPCRTAKHRLLVRTLLYTLLISTTTALVDQNDAVLLALVDRLPRTRRQTARIRAMVTDAL